MAIAKNDLSGSTTGRGIKIVATATPGTTIHTARTGTTNWDEVWIYAVNSSASTVKLTIEWGGTTAPDDLIEVGIPPENGLVLVAPGLLIQNSLVISAFASVANVIIIYGFVNEITP